MFFYFSIFFCCCRVLNPWDLLFLFLGGEAHRCLKRDLFSVKPLGFRNFL